MSGGRAQPADLRTERIRATVSRLVEARGSVLSDFDAHGSLDHVTMADPEGNEFCLPPDAVYSADGTEMLGTIHLVG